MQLAVVFAFWNPSNSIRVNENCLRFEKWLDQANVQYWKWNQVPPDAEQFIFQKEAALNIEIKNILQSSDVDAVAWLDADIQFLRPDWYDAARTLLDKHPVIQLFEICHMLDAKGRVETASPGYQYQLAHNIKPQSGQGFAWAAHRSVLEQSGLFDLNVTGGGDAMMAAAWNNRPNDMGVAKTSDGLRARWMDWKRLQEDIGAVGNVGYLEGDIIHYYHGTIENRQYSNRTHVLRQHAFEPDIDIDHDAAGLLRWTGKNPGLEAAVKELFLSRREDE